MGCGAAMRWVILTDEHPPAVGGVATWTALTAEALRRRGHQVRVYARARDGLSGATAVHGPSYGRRGGVWAALRALPQLARADAVLATTWPMAVGAVGLGRVHVVAHGSDVTRPPITGGFDRTWMHASRRWAVSRYLCDVLADRRIAAEPLPVPIAPGPPRPPSQTLRRIGMVARATPWKGGERFVRLVAALGLRGEVVGDGPALGAWQRLAAAEGADIAFSGRLSRAAVVARIRTWDAVALLSRPRPDGSGAEGLGLTLLEGAAVGVPAIGVRTGGVPEAVGPGLVLDAPDDASMSADAVRDWWAPAQGARARAWLGDLHGPDRTVDRLVDPR